MGSELRLATRLRGGDIDRDSSSVLLSLMSDFDDTLFFSKLFAVFGFGVINFTLISSLISGFMSRMPKAFMSMSNFSLTV